MRNRPWINWFKILPALAIIAFFSGVAAQGQSAPGSSAAVDTIKVESRVVLVDTVVTDKKGNYIRDLAAGDFKIWEDGKEQAVSSFSREISTTVRSGRRPCATERTVVSEQRPRSPTVLAEVFGPGQGRELLVPGWGVGDDGRVPLLGWVAGPGWPGWLPGREG